MGQHHNGIRPVRWVVYTTVNERDFYICANEEDIFLSSDPNACECLKFDVNEEAQDFAVTQSDDKKIYKVKRLPL